MKLLTFSGGGCYGAFQAAVLDDMDTAKLDAVAGTSIGSCMAASAALGKTSGLLRFFRGEMPKVFKGHGWRRFKWPLPKYPDAALNRALQTWFGGARLGDARGDLFITAMRDTGRPKVFHSRASEDAVLPLWQVVRMSCAAPSYFAPFGGYLDGGLWANNPVAAGMAGLVKARAIDAGSIDVLSIGTGKTVEDAPIGPCVTYAQTVRLLTRALMFGASDVAQAYLAEAFNRPRRPGEIDFVPAFDGTMDDPGVIEQIISLHQAEIDAGRCVLGGWLM